MDERDDKGMQVYLREIGRVELLPPEEELRLARRVRRGDAAAREKMIKANLRLVVRIAKDYARIGLPLLDLISEGNIGLMKAVDRYDPEVGTKFSTYAAWWIKQGIRRALANHGNTVRLPAHLVDKLFQMRRAQEELLRELGRVPTAAELGERLGIGEAEARRWQELSQGASSLDVPLGGEPDGHTLGELLADDGAKLPADVLGDRQLRAEMMRHLGELGERERRVLTRRFGLDGNPPQLLEEIGAAEGVSRERIRQVQEHALKQLREKMMEDFG
ncbi:MAG: sigma-70 family RNA polymerase sigma factor [Kiritimatiellae bacterium]|nr:sigma-70 family RNA polymerase sigma factor [Kiritimatiellia bacterium]